MKNIPFYTKIEVQITCPECAQPVFIYGPFTEVKCGYCDSIVTVDPNDTWQSLLEEPESEIINFLSDGALFHGGRHDPCCSNCKKKLKVDDIEDGDDKIILCSSCSAENSTFPPPEWMKKISLAEDKKNMKPVQLFCAENETSVKPQSGGSGLVLFSCLQCGASLKISPETPRILSLIRSLSM